MFENGVNLYGSQAQEIVLPACLLFENGVNLYGSQAAASFEIADALFENGVNLYRTGVISKTDREILESKLNMMKNVYFGKEESDVD